MAHGRERPAWWDAQQCRGVLRKLGVIGRGERPPTPQTVGARHEADWALGCDVDEVSFGSLYCPPRSLQVRHCQANTGVGWARNGAKPGGGEEHQLGTMRTCLLRKARIGSDYPVDLGVP